LTSDVSPVNCRYQLYIYSLENMGIVFFSLGTLKTI
jgi:hypothetical protein